MKVKVEKAGACRKAMKIEIPAEKVSEEFENVIKASMKVAVIPGFRKGRAPRNLVETRFKKNIEEEVQERLLVSSYRDALKEQGIDPVAVLGVEDVSLSRGEPMKCTVVLDVPPEFKLPKYKGLSLKAKPSEVTDEDVQKRIDGVMEGMAKYEDVERPVAEGDLVQVDFDGTCEGQPVEEFASGAAGLGVGRDFWVMCDENSFLPGFGQALIGAAAGDERSVEVTYPEDIRVKELAGKVGNYSVKVKLVREKRIPPIDEEVLKRFEMKSEDELRQKIRERLEAEANAEHKRNLKDEIVTILLNKTSMDLPETLVAEETRNMLFDVVRDNMRRGVSREEIEDKRETLRSEAAKNAEERVKLGYVLHRISDEEQIKIEDKEVDELIELLAMRNGKPADEFRKELIENERMDSLRHQVRMDKTLDFILENAKIGAEGFLDRFRK